MYDFFDYAIGGRIMSNYEVILHHIAVSTIMFSVVVSPGIVEVLVQVCHANTIHLLLVFGDYLGNL